ncbi:hypothetical protein A4U61_21405 [Streptomyces sp. H-KF8]|nr:hypothetical protein A4U61_21405 [Streptomyces sp. H-KF8]
MTTGTTGRTATADRTVPPSTYPGAPAGRPHRRISARVRILLWFLFVMTVALASVATTTRSFLLRDVDHRINGLLAQETGEFANFERQYADPDEELVGLVARRAVPGGAHGPGRAAGSQAEVSGTQRPSTVR